jgi:hypothetical protein
MASKTGASVIEFTARQKTRFPVPLPQTMSGKVFQFTVCRGSGWLCGRDAGNDPRRQLAAPKRGDGGTPDDPASPGGFWALIVTQFQGAFSDNALKQLALFIGIRLGMGEKEQDRLSSLTMALLTLPFLFFSMFGGALGQPGLLLVRGPNVMKVVSASRRKRRSVARRLVRHRRHGGAR